MDAENDIRTHCVYCFHCIYGETRGAQLRPHVVWFGEAVPMMEPAIELTMRADIFLVVGTSLAVYPAASLLQFVRPDAEKYIVTLDLSSEPQRDFVWLKEKASIGVPKLIERWGLGLYL